MTCLRILGPSQHTPTVYSPSTAMQSHASERYSVKHHHASLVARQVEMTVSRSCLLLPRRQLEDGPSPESVRPTICLLSAYSYIALAYPGNVTANWLILNQTPYALSTIIWLLVHFFPLDALYRLLSADISYRIGQSAVRTCGHGVEGLHLGNSYCATRENKEVVEERVHPSAKQFGVVLHRALVVIQCGPGAGRLELRCGSKNAANILLRRFNEWLRRARDHVVKAVREYTRLECAHKTPAHDGHERGSSR
jgi:hypothetical protein